MQTRRLYTAKTITGDDLMWILSIDFGIILVRESHGGSDYRGFDLYTRIVGKLNNNWNLGFYFEKLLIHVNRELYVGI